MAPGLRHFFVVLLLALVAIAAISEAKPVPEDDETTGDEGRAIKNFRKPTGPFNRVPRGPVKYRCVPIRSIMGGAKGAANVPEMEEATEEVDDEGRSMFKPTGGHKIRSPGQYKPSKRPGMLGAFKTKDGRICRPVRNYPSGPIKNVKNLHKLEKDEYDEEIEDSERNITPKRGVLIDDVSIWGSRKTE